MWRSTPSMVPTQPSMDPDIAILGDTFYGDTIHIININILTVSKHPFKIPLGWISVWAKECNFLLFYHLPLRTSVVELINNVAYASASKQYLFDYGIIIINKNMISRCDKWWTDRLMKGCIDKGNNNIIYTKTWGGNLYWPNSMVYYLLQKSYLEEAGRENTLSSMEMAHWHGLGIRIVQPKDL